MTSRGVTREIARLAAVALLAATAVPAALGRQGVPAAGDSIRESMVVSTAWLAEHLRAPGVVVLHVAMDRAHYDAGHVPGARLLLWSDMTVTRGATPNELPPAADLCRLFERLGIGSDGRVVLYGDNGGLSAARAYFTLDYLGHGDRASLLDGGLEKWRSEARSISTEAAVPSPAPFVARLRPETVVGLDAVRDLSWAAGLRAASAALVDARSPEEFGGARAGDGVARPGHIPGAVNVFWKQNLATPTAPSMRPAADLRRMYEAAGVLPGQRVVTYCRTGGQASVTYFTLKYLGYSVAMYDASFVEWSGTPDTQVVAGSAP